MFLDEKSCILVQFRPQNLLLQGCKEQRITAKSAAKLGLIDSWEPGSLGPGLKLRLLFNPEVRLWTPSGGYQVKFIQSRVVK